jgi:hypothetical protein
VVYRRLRLALATTCSSRDVPHARAACFLVVANIVVGHGRNPLRTLLVPLLAARSALLGIVDDDVERRLLATARGLLPVAWGRVKFDRLIVGGILSDDVAQLLGGVPKNVAQCLVGRRSLCDTHTAFGNLHP